MKKNQTLATENMKKLVGICNNINFWAYNDLPMGGANALLKISALDYR
jgi:hypothetical protein